MPLAALSSPGYGRMDGQPAVYLYIAALEVNVLSCRRSSEIVTPFGVQIAAPAATVFDVIAAPYLGRTPRAMSGKLQVLQRGTDMVLAGHYTPVHHGRLTAATLETVTFDRPHTISFRLVRGPVPCLTEDFTIAEDNGTTRLEYSGEPGTDFAAAGQWRANRVAAAWEAAVRSSFRSIQTEAERRVTPGTTQS